MKKTVAVLLALCLMLTAALALAEEAYHFTFRGGVEWDMSSAAVQEIEGAPAADGHQDERYSTCKYTGVKISKSNGVPVYVFREDVLKVIGYQIPDAADADFSYLESALAQVYGEPGEADTARLAAALNETTGIEYTAEDFTNAHSWQLADGTTVDLVMEQGAMVIYYISPNYSDIYNVQGL